MDGNGQRENGRHKVDQYKSIHTQWMMPQHQMKDNPTMKLMAFVAERDKAFHERNLALNEKRAALTERDMAFLQRDAAIAEQNTAIMERDDAIAALDYARENSMNRNSSPGCTAPHETKHIHLHQQHQQHLRHVHHQPSDYPYHHTREMHISEAYPISAVSEDVAKVRKAKCEREETKADTAPSKKPSKSPRKSKRGAGEDLNKRVKIQSPHDEWRGDFRGGEDLNKQASMMEHQEWKDQDLGLNQVTFDDSMMPVPVCSCTGKYQQCYKWGSGGWQSACCTMTLSMYPLPAMPNKRHARVGGRKMSGGVFTRLLSRLAAEGHDLSTPLDLKDHWAKHGTNRYVTIK